MDWWIGFRVSWSAETVGGDLISCRVQGRTCTDGCATNTGRLPGAGATSGKSQATRGGGTNGASQRASTRKARVVTLDELVEGYTNSAVR